MPPVAFGDADGATPDGGIAHSSLGALQPFSTLMVMEESPHQTGHSPVGGSIAVPCARELAQHLPSPQSGPRMKSPGSVGSKTF